MKYFFVITLFFVSVKLLAQDEDADYKKDTAKYEINFSFNLQQTKINNSYYKTIHVLDERKDSSNLGTIEFSDKTATIKVKHSLNEEFEQLLNAITDSSAGNGDLLLVIRRLEFWTVWENNKLDIFYFLRMYLYDRKDNNYRQLAAFDTTVSATFGLFKKNMSDKVFASCSKTMADLLSRNLTRMPDTTASYLMQSLSNVDSIEKIKIPLYANNILRDGIYGTYASFKKQQPDTNKEYPVTVKNEKPVGVSVKSKEVNDKNVSTESIQTVPMDNFYALVYKGNAYISNDGNFCPLEKRKEDFYFTGKLDRASSNEIPELMRFANSATGLPFQIIGFLLSSGSKKYLFELKIDYLDGSFIPVKQIEN